MGKILSLFVFIWVFHLLSSGEAFATTFAEFPIVRQIESAQYTVRGRIGRTWAKLDERLKRPFTYWTMSVTDSYSDNKLDGQITIREMGGEVGDLGYRVPGSAEFSEGEDVVVMLRDSTEEAKDVIGLMSGKYSVFKRENGQDALRSGLGIDLLASNGEPMDPDAFRDLVGRVKSHSATDADRMVTINPMMAIHHDSTDSHASNPNTPDSRAIAAATTDNIGSKTPPSTTANVSTNSLEKANQRADRHIASQSESSWIGFFVGGLFLICAVFMFRLLTRKPQT